MDPSDRWNWITRVRPMILGSALLRLLAPQDRRQIFTTATGLKIYADPLSNFGNVLRLTGTYEPDMTDLFQKLLRPGMRVLDIGANEGYFSALAGKLCGPNGYVIAVEPQSRLRDLIEINARLNGVERLRVYTNGLGGDEGTHGTLNLYPSLNTGAASVVHRYRFLRRSQTFEFVSFATLLESAGADRFDLAKIDVEGFEPEVVHHLLPHIESGQVIRLVLDYHESILASRNIDPRSVHEELLRAGMQVEQGDPANLSSYLLYSRATQ